MSKFLTLSLLGLILSSFNQLYTMDQQEQSSWFSPVALVTTGLAALGIGYVGSVLKKRHDKKEKLISKKEVMVGITASLLAGSFFLEWRKNYHIIAPILMVPDKKLNNNIPWTHSEVLWETFINTPTTLAHKSLAFISELTGVLASPLALFPAVFNPIDSAVGSKGLCASLILPPVMQSAYSYIKQTYLPTVTSVASVGEVYEPEKDNCKGFSAIIGGVPNLMKHIMTVLQATPEKIKQHGVTLPKGIIFYGPPGTGKTALARAFCEELIMNGIKTVFISLSAAELKDELISKGAKNVKALFKKARSYVELGNKVIIFIDEIDTIASKRQERLGGDQNETINQFLADLDGIDKTINKDILIIGATNRFQSLDTAVTRGGRLECHIGIPLPNLAAKKAIFNSYLQQYGFKEKEEEKLDEETEVKISLQKLYIQDYLSKPISGADIESLVKRAGMIAFSSGNSLSLDHIEQTLGEITQQG